MRENRFMSAFLLYWAVSTAVALAPNMHYYTATGGGLNANLVSRSAL